MSKEFNVPPVIFSYGGNPDTGAQQRCLPPASILFSTPQFGNISGSSAIFDNELPFLEELGINTKQFWNKMTSILNPFRVEADLHEDSNLSGPVLFVMAFGLFQLLAGKLHFGIIVGWVTVASMFLYVVFNRLARQNGNLDLYRCLSLIGYCMLPEAMLSAVSLFVPQGGLVICMMMGGFQGMVNTSVHKVVGGAGILWR